MSLSGAKGESMRKRISVLGALLAAGCLLCGAGLSACAYTIEDVIEKSREVGIPEAQIQTGVNNWETGKYTQENLDAIYGALVIYGADADDMLRDFFEQNGETLPTEPPAETLPPDAPESTAPAESAPAETEPAKDFISMTADEKRAYVNAMPPEEREAFLANLTPAERNSILKQMSVEDQMALLENYIGIAEDMGIHVEVNSISEEGLGVTMRDENGTIIDKTQTGITIDPTGISYDGLLLAAALSVLLAVGGFTAVYRHLCRNEQLN